MVILCMTEDTVKKGPPIVADLEHVHRFFFFIIVVRLMIHNQDLKNG